MRGQSSTRGKMCAHILCGLLGVPQAAEAYTHCARLPRPPQRSRPSSMHRTDSDPSGPIASGIS